MKIINIARDYSDTPLGRYRTDGSFSGQRFREEFLVPALKSGAVTVEIDGTEGYGSSFLEEAFGGLVRKEKFTADNLRKNLIIDTNDPAFRVYDQLIRKYVDDAEAKLKG